MRSRALLAGIVALGGAGVTAVALAATDTRKSATTAWRPLAAGRRWSARRSPRRGSAGTSTWSAASRRPARGTTAAMERYDLRPRTAGSGCAPIPLAVNHATAVAYRGRLYVHGGYTDASAARAPSGACYVYNPRTGRWRRLPDSPTPAGRPRGRRWWTAGCTRPAAPTPAARSRRMDVLRLRPPAVAHGPAAYRARRAITPPAWPAAGASTCWAGARAPRNYTAAERYDPGRRRWQRLPADARARGGSPPWRCPAGGSRSSAARTSAPGGRSARWSCWTRARAAGAGCPDMRTPRHGLGGVARGNRIYVAARAGPQPGLHFSSDDRVPGRARARDPAQGRHPRPPPPGGHLPGHRRRRGGLPGGRRGTGRGRRRVGAPGRGRVPVAVRPVGRGRDGPGALHRVPRGRRRADRGRWTPAPRWPDRSRPSWAPTPCSTRARTWWR